MKKSLFSILRSQMITVYCLATFSRKKLGLLNKWLNWWQSDRHCSEWGLERETVRSDEVRVAMLVLGERPRLTQRWAGSAGMRTAWGGGGLSPHRVWAVLKRRTQPRRTRKPQQHPLPPAPPSPARATATCRPSRCEAGSALRSIPGGASPGWDTPSPGLGTQSEMDDKRAVPFFCLFFFFFKFYN